MTQSLFSKLNLSKERLQDLQKDLEARRDNLEARSNKAVGRLRDASLTTIYEFGANTLDRAAELSDRVPVVRGGAEGLRKRAESLKDAGEAVQKPPIEDYDELNVKQVADALDGLSAYELEKVRRYEEAHKNRVTVLRDVESRI